MADKSMTLFHMSDVHVGEVGVTVDDFKRIIDFVERRARDVVSPMLLVTGDLTSDGLKEEYDAFAEAIGAISLPKVIIPGNHDERNYGSAHFERLFGPRFKRYEDENVAIYAADSAEPDNDAGHVGRAQYPFIQDFFNNARNKVRVFAVHHHLVAVPFTGREHNVVEDAGDVLGVLDQTRCSLVLNGHRHVPWFWRLNDMILYNTGTLLSRRVRGATTQVMSEITISKNDATFTLRQKDGSERVFGRATLRV